MAKEKIQDSIVKVAAEVGSKTALDVYTKQKEKEKKMRIDRRLRDTKRLMRSYREIKVHAGDAIASLSEVVNEDYEFFKDLMEDTGKIDVGAIVRSKARSAIMLTHIDAMLQAYEIICYNSKKPEEQRRYRVLESMCLMDEPIPVSEIAERENIDTRTVYKDLDAACEKMSALLFGIQWIERE
jgi:hypothetical protein